MGTVDVLCEQCKQPFKANGLVDRICAWCREKNEKGAHSYDIVGEALDVVKRARMGRGVE